MLRGDTVHRETSSTTAICGMAALLNESEMKIFKWLIEAATILIAIIMITPFYGRAQISLTLQPGFGQAITAVDNAEAAGAYPNEILPLVALLNRALDLNQEASMLNQTGEHDRLISSANQVLANVTNQADYVTTRSAERAYSNKIITYASGIIIAVLGTFGYVVTAEFYERYRIRRTFQMKVKRR